MDTTSAVHPKLKQISYSSVLNLHSCPRRFQLSKLQEKVSLDSEGNPLPETNVTFAYGHAVGAGIQEYLLSQDLFRAVWKAFLEWDADLLDEETKAQKSIWFAVHAVEKFVPVYNGTHLDEYELCYVDNLPAIELSFSIVLPNGFIYRGFVDAVLKHKHTGQLLVLELKTTSLTNIDEAQYRTRRKLLDIQSS